MENSFKKIVDVDEILCYFQSGMSLLVGGFGGVGNPPTLIDAIFKKGVNDLEIICNDAGFPEIGIGRLVSAGFVKKIIASHIGSNPVAGELMTKKEF